MFVNQIKSGTIQVDVLRSTPSGLFGNHEESVYFLKWLVF